jgi:protein O-GlcNAc transferase
MNESSNKGANQLIDQALREHQAGRLKEAAELYDRVLEIDPNNADALHLRGVVAHQSQEEERAAALIQQAIDIDPFAAEFHNNLGEVFRFMHQMEKAIASYQRSLELEPDRAETLRNLGLAAQEDGDFALALDAWDRALALDAHHAETINNRGVTLRYLNRADEAIDAFQAAIEAKPDFLEPFENLLATLNRLGRHDEAISIATMVVNSRPDTAMPLVNLGCALIDAGRAEEAITPLYHAIKLDPQCASAHLAIGMAFCATRELRGAELAFRRAISIRSKFLPVYVQLSFVLLQRGEAKSAIVAAQQGIDQFPRAFELHQNLSSALYQANFMEEAAKVAEKALEIRPKSTVAMNLLATILTRLSQYERAEKIYRQAIALAPNDLGVIGNYATMMALKGDLKSAIESFRATMAIGSYSADFHSNMLLYMNGLPGLEPQEIFEEHLRWGKFHADPLLTSTPEFQVTREPDRPLRVGYVSGDWRFHSVAYFITPLLAAHNRDNVIPVVYDNVPQPDLMTKHIRSLVGEWHRIIQLNDDEFAQKIRDDKIDILVDLSGHTGGHRLRTFARRAAPVQVNYLGYPNTTGMTTMDYRLTDAVVDPPELSDAFHSEKLSRVEPPFICYLPSDDAPEVTELPALKRGSMTFCSFNAISKFNSNAIEVWARVLTALPDSRMLIKAAGLQEIQTQKRVIEDFERFGVASSRLELLPRAPSHKSHMGTYGECDLALDTFPYNGTTTTCEAFWMGVPVITTHGPTHASRVSMTLLKSIGLDEFVADDADQFVEIAVRLSKDLPRLAEIRRTMRERMMKSTLMDAKRKAASIEAAYRSMWKHWCQQNEPK